jgi:catechol 2,3-dioxygenase-like lactoylglutathione lyase family enzyme
VHITIDLDVEQLDRAVAFWCAALGYEPVGGAAQYAAIAPGVGRSGPKLILQRVDEPKLAKNRMHLDLDLDPGEDLDAEVARLESLGATRRWGPVTELGLRWFTLADPDGNEFCVVAPPT